MLKRSTLDTELPMYRILLQNLQLECCTSLAGLTARKGVGVNVGSEG
jgi:hypothetical protein